MAEGKAREVLLRVADRLSVDLGDAPVGDPLPAEPFLDCGGVPREDALAAEDELLVATVRSGLAQLAVALGAVEQPETAQRLIAAALDSAERTMRGDLMRGRSERLPALMPSFVFLVALPIVDQDEAFDLAQRTVELLRETRRQL